MGDRHGSCRQVTDGDSVPTSNSAGTKCESNERAEEVLGKGGASSWTGRQGRGRIRTEVDIVAFKLSLKG